MSTYLNDDEVKLSKEDLCYYGSITYLMSGIFYFYYLNSINDCVCVNKEYIKNIKTYFIISSVLYIINCIRCNSKEMSNLLSMLLIICGIGFIYNMRLLINDIYKKSCECADTNITSIVNILNYVAIFIYIQWFIVISLLLILILTKQTPNPFEDYAMENVDDMDNMDNMDDGDNVDDMDDDYNNQNTKLFKEIKKVLRQKKMNGGSVENLAKSFLKNKEGDGLKKILSKLLQ